MGQQKEQPSKSICPSENAWFTPDEKRPLFQQEKHNESVHVDDKPAYADEQDGVPYVIVLQQRLQRQWHLSELSILNKSVKF